jgi:hypothetical protein
MVGLDPIGYQRRYCYEHRVDAQTARATWDADEFSGPWIKRKGADSRLLNPGCWSPSSEGRARETVDAALSQNPCMDAFAIDLTKVNDISNDLLDGRGRLRIVAARTLERTTAEERLLFGVQQGLYGLPTQELCDFLRARIAGRTAIEIGAGHGALAEALSIPATDNRQQKEEDLKAYYQDIGQPTVRYGDNVEKLDALAAVAKYRPQVVIACWVTHRFEPDNPEAGGSVTGVDEAALIAECEEYIFIGNERVHAPKPIWRLPHEKTTPSWLFSRAVNGSKDFIAIWRQREASSVSGEPS